MQGYTIWRAVRLVPSAGFVYQAWADSAGEWNRIDGCPGVGQCGTYGNYTTPGALVNHWTGHPQPDTTQLELELVCGNSQGCAKVQPNANSVWIFHSAVALQDNSAPQLAGAPSGPLVSGGVLSGVEPVSVGATDQGGGVYQAEIEVDGQILDRQVLDNSTGTCQTPFTAVVPCPLSASGTIALNTAQIPDGTHSLQILVTDAAGNTAAWGPVTITTVNNPCTPVPAATGMTLGASLVSRVHKHTRFSRALTIRYSQRPTVVGSLTASGAPVGGAAVCVATQADYAGAPLREAATVTTSAGGTFGYRLGRGPSRTVYFIHRVAGGAIATAVHVSVHVPVAVHLNATRLRNGQSMIWKGRLPGPVPPGVLALMEVWRGTFWQPIGQQVAVARSGRWVGRYRFSFTSGVQHYVFRLLVPHQTLYPYAAGSSRKLRVVVTG